jgi:nitroreductase
VERDESWGREIENGVLATAFLILAAQDRGLGSVYLTAYRGDDPELAREIRAALGLADGLEAIAIVPLGYPAEAPEPKPLQPLEEIVVR